jgi:hypothetical protein
MSFDDDDQGSQDKTQNKSKKFFGLELGDGITYIIVIVLALIFIRQVSVLF